MPQKRGPEGTSLDLDALFRAQKHKKGKAGKEEQEAKTAPEQDPARQVCAGLLLSPAHLASWLCRQRQGVSGQPCHKQARDRAGQQGRVECQSAAASLTSGTRRLPLVLPW